VNKIITLHQHHFEILKSHANFKRINLTPEEYASQDKKSINVKIPDKCQFQDCGVRVSMKKHGFYERYYIKAGFNQRIPIRRLRCPVCGRTLSIMPIFIAPKFQYCPETILKYVYGALIREGTLQDYLIKMNCQNNLDISRQLLYFYLKRIRGNIPFIIAGLRHSNPAILLPEARDEASIVKLLLETESCYVKIQGIMELTGKHVLELAGRTGGEKWKK
jgi:hypothetical protein